MMRREEMVCDLAQEIVDAMALRAMPTWIMAT